MKNRVRVLLASSSVLAIVSTMAAHTALAAAPSQQIAADDTGATEEIIVTARRKEENLLDVPEIVKAVTAAEIQKFNINQFEDIQKLVAGLTLDPQTGSTGGAGNYRGLAFGGIFPGASSLQFYVNDAALDQQFAYLSMYDIGDIEALSGPQGTTRGRLADTGAITITTHVPDLEKVGGYGEVTHGSLRDNDIQAAVGVPIIQDKLGVRIAGIYDETDDNDVNSLYNQVKPSRVKEGGRVTARFVPTDDIDVLVSYQHMRQREINYGSFQYGPGNADGGPALAPTQRLTIEAGLSNNNPTNSNDLEGKLDWTFFGQKLTTVTGLNNYGNAPTIDDVPQNGGVINQIPGFENFNTTSTEAVKDFNQDIRLASAEPLFNGHLEYVVGFYYDHRTIDINAPLILGYLPGAFVNNQVNFHDVIEAEQTADQDNNERAYYANATVHITKQDEITAGIRHGAEQHDIKSVQIGGFALGPPDVATYHPTIYNIEASHHFNDDLMVYARTADTWRAGVVNVLYLLTLTGPQASLFNPLIYPAAPETSKDYEAGIKGDAFDKRLTFSLDYYHQVYKNFLGYTSNAVYHLTPALGVLTTTYSGLQIQAEPATIDGIDATASMKITKRWSVSGDFGWTDGRVTGPTPCNPPGITAPIPSAAAAAQALAALGTTLYDTCSQKAATSLAPKWTANLSSEYDQPITDKVDGFIRGLFDYRPKNPNSGNPNYVTPAYGTLDLYLGVRDPDSAWEVSVYSKNITNNQTLLTTTPLNPPSNNPNASVGFSLYGLGYTGANTAGYNSGTLVNPREFGITARYAFGAR